jgi:hypothetical protein
VSKREAGCRRWKLLDHLEYATVSVACTLLRCCAVWERLVRPFWLTLYL